MLCCCHCHCCCCRGPGQIVGDTSLGKPTPAAATVRARSRMRVLLVRPADAAALVTQPSVKAALYRTQTESSVLDALETFAAYDGEVAAIDEVRRSRAASFALAARGPGGLVSAGSGAGLCGGLGSGQWSLAPASSAGSSALESYGSVASSLASFTSAGQATAAPPVSGRSSPLPPMNLAALPEGGGGGFSLPARVPSRTAGSLGAAVAAEFTAQSGPQAVGSMGGSPLRPGSRGNSFTAGSSTPRGQGGLRGGSSRLGLSVQLGGPSQRVAQGTGSGSPLPSPRV